MRLLKELAFSQAKAGRLHKSRFIWRMLAGANPKSLTRLADKWVDQGHFEEALALLFEGTQMRPPVQRLSLERYLKMCHWLAVDGHLLEADRRLQALTDAQPTKQTGAERQVRFFIQYANLAPENIQKIVEFIEQNPKSAFVHKSLRYLAVYGLDETRLEGLYTKALEGAADDNEARDLIAYDYLSLFGEKEENGDFLQRLSQEIKYDYSLSSASIDNLIRTDRIQLPGIGENEAKAQAFSRRFSEGNEAIWRKLTNPKISIAIVGNSPNLIGSGSGKEIDAHDVVIRFNGASLTEELKVDTGAKTDLLVLNQAILARESTAELKDTDVIVTGPDWKNFTFGKLASEKLFNQGCRIATISKSLRCQLIDTLWATPSSGMGVLFAIAQQRGSSKNLSCFGFSFTDQIGAKPASANYFRASKPSPRHNWAGEAVLFEHILKGEFPPSLDIADKQRLRYSNMIGDAQDFRPMRIKLGGNHSKYHCGSWAVVRHMRARLGNYGVVVSDDSFDVLVMNGEGSMHHDSPAYHTKMAEMKAAVDAGKPVYLVNTVWQENMEVDVDLLKQLQLIQVREKASQNDLFTRHGIHASLHPDLSFYCKLDKATPDLRFKDNIVLTDFYSHEFKTFARWTGAEGLKYPHIDMRKTTWSQMVADLASAEMLVTGRHHAVFAACRANTPFIAFAGNTHKVSGLLDAAGVNIPMAKHREELPELIDWVRNNNEEYQRLFRWLDRFPTWTPFF